jgi:hypothetical protein
MAADPEALEPTLWHAALRENDARAHDQEDSWVRLHAVETLERRLAQANADRHAYREAVRLRDLLLAEQRVAVEERDRLVAELDARLAEVEAARAEAVAIVQMAAAPLHRRALRRARRVLGRVLHRLAR